MTEQYPLPSISQPLHRVSDYFGCMLAVTQHQTWLDFCIWIMLAGSLIFIFFIFFFKMKYNTSNNPQPSRICFLFTLMVLLAGMFCESQAGEFTSNSEDIQSHQMARLPPTLTLKSCLYCIYHCSLRGYYKTHTRGHICPFFQILLCARFFQ